MTQEQEQQQVNAIDWLVEQIKPYNDVNSIDPFVLIDLKYEAKKMYYIALHDEFKRGLDIGCDIGKQIFNK